MREPSQEETSRSKNIFLREPSREELVFARNVPEPGEGRLGKQHRGCGNTGMLIFFFIFDYRCVCGGGGGRTRWVAVLCL